MNRRLFISQATASLALPFLPTTGFSQGFWATNPTLRVLAAGPYHAPAFLNSWAALPGVTIATQADERAVLHSLATQPAPQALLVSQESAHATALLQAASRAGVPVYLSAATAPGQPIAMALPDLSTCASPFILAPYIHRSLPWLQEAAAVVQNGIIGPVRRATAWSQATSEHHTALAELDCCRWLMGESLPTTVQSIGPNIDALVPTYAAQFTFTDCTISWQRLTNTAPQASTCWGITLYGSRGVLSFHSQQPMGLRLNDLTGSPIATTWANKPLPTDPIVLETFHMQHFVTALQEKHPFTATVDNLATTETYRQLLEIARQTGQPLPADRTNAHPTLT